MRKWKTEDSAELYNINGWGLNYFSINDKGHVSVCPKAGGPSIDLEELMEELQIEDVAAPVLLRFPDILNNRIEKISGCFEIAAKEYGFTAKNYIIYPIKVNQMRPVVEEIVSHGNKFNIGLEAGSKPELHAVLSIDIDSDAMIICNGYKDESYIELALLAQKMGRQIFIVVEKMKELQTIADLSKRMNIQPNIGIRIKLASSGSGKWEESGGDVSKFGLNSSELLEALELLEAVPDEEKAYIELFVRIADVPPAYCMERANRIVSGKKCRFCRYKWERVSAEQEERLHIIDADKLLTLSPQEVASVYYQDKYGQDMGEDLRVMLDTAVRRVKEAGD